MRSLGLSVNDRNKIKATVKEAYRCKIEGVQHVGKIKHRGGTAALITKGSKYITMLADAKEMGMSNKDALTFINETREDAGLQLFGLNAIVGALLRMQKREERVCKQSQGSNDPASNWAIARDNFTTQILIRIDIENKGVHYNLDHIKERNGGNLPDGYKYDKLMPIHKEAVAWWDETHRDCCVHDLGGSVRHLWKFPRDAEGNYDEEGRYNDHNAKEYTFKYNSQVRLSLGAAQKRDADGDLVGCRLPPFDYTQKKMISVSQFIEKEKIEVARVRREGKEKEWVDNSRPANTTYLCDPPSILPGVGKVVQKALLEVGIRNIGEIRELKDKTEGEIDNLLTNIAMHNNKRSITKTKLLGLIQSCVQLGTLHDKPPPAKDWRKEAHPYRARYPDTWREKMMTSKTFKGLTSVHELVEHIWSVSEAHFRGTEHEDTWWIYHDALSIMTESKTVEWMRSKGYLRRWILPELGINDGIGSFGGRPTGNSPEYMPWDASLNQDVHESVRRHCILSRAALKRIDKNGVDERKFSLATPKLGKESYLRILHPCTGCSPSPERINEDIGGVWKAMDIVRQHRGVYVPGLAERTGRRYEMVQEVDQRGGPRTKGDPSIAHLKKITSMHGDLRDMRKEERRKVLEDETGIRYAEEEAI